MNNLGLGVGSALPVGVPVPLATAPVGWLKCNGAAFTASQYPKLTQAYPALKLPDLRGEFIRAGTMVVAWIPVVDCCQHREECHSITGTGCPLLTGRVEMAR